MKNINVLKSDISVILTALITRLSNNDLSGAIAVEEQLHDKMQELKGVLNE